MSSFNEGATVGQVLGAWLATEGHSTQHHTLASVGPWPSSTQLSLRTAPQRDRMAMCCGSSPRRAAAAAAAATGGGWDAPPPAPPPTMASRAEQLTMSELEERYETREICGEGKFAVVRRARLRSVGGATEPQELALKFIDKRVAHRDESNVEREVDIALSVAHPNVVRSFQALETAQHVVLCMELVDGLDAFEHYSAQAERLGPVGLAPEREVAGHCRDVLQALEYLHARGIAHRDLKMENIMITAGGRAVVVDFGCAGRVSSGESGGVVGVMHTMCGTLEYAAPELLLDAPYGVACDLWSLGVVAFILLSGGDRPFWDGNQKKLIKMVSDGSGKHRHSYRGAAWTKRSLSCRAFIDSCLTKDPTHRPAATTLLAGAWMQLAPRPSEAAPGAAVHIAEAEPPQSHDAIPRASSGLHSEAADEDDTASKALQARRRFRLAGHTIGAVVRWRSFADTPTLRRELVDSSAEDDREEDGAAEEAAGMDEAARKALQARRRFRMAGHTIGAVVRWRSFAETPSVRQELVERKSSA